MRGMVMSRHAVSCGKRTYLPVVHVLAPDLLPDGGGLVVELRDPVLQLLPPMVKNAHWRCLRVYLSLHRDRRCGCWDDDTRRLSIERAQGVPRQSIDPTYP